MAASVKGTIVTRNEKFAAGMKAKPHLPCDALMIPTESTLILGSNVISAHVVIVRC